MDPEKQKQQFRLLAPTIIGVALIVILRAFDQYLPGWLAQSLYVVLTVGCIVNAVRVIRANRANRE